MSNSTHGLSRIIKAAGYSWKGIYAAWHHEAAFRQEVIIAVIAVIIVVWLDIDAISRVLLIGSVLLVIIVEIINSAIEAVVDRISLTPTSYPGVLKIWDQQQSCWRLSWLLSPG